MKPAPVPVNEVERLASLKRLNILDTPSEERFDIITRTAVHVLNVPISTVTLVDSNREWFKSCQGLDAKEGDRAISFCGHAMLADEILIIPDAKLDPRFSDNPMVIGKPFIRYYLGVPLFSAEGHRIGTFCVKDTKPRPYPTRKEIETIKGLASWAEVELNAHELSIALKARKSAEEKVGELNDILKLLNKILRHDMLNNLTVIKGGLDTYITYKDKISLDSTVEAVQRSIVLISQMRELESAVSSGSPLKRFALSQVVEKVKPGFPELEINLRGKVEVMADEALISVMENIIRNAQMHGKTKKVEISTGEIEGMTEVNISDEGKGIPDEVKSKLFREGFKYGETGHTGLGLYIVRKTMERYGGGVSVGDNHPQGAVFTLRFPRIN